MYGKKIDQVGVVLQCWQISRACFWAQTFSLCSKSKMLFYREWVLGVPSRKDKVCTTNYIFLVEEEVWQKRMKESDLVVIFKLQKERKQDTLVVYEWLIQTVSYTRLNLQVLNVLVELLNTFLLSGYFATVTKGVRHMGEWNHLTVWNYLTVWIFSLERSKSLLKKTF